MEKQPFVHLISFNIPYPANYGGVIGVFYHLKALKKLGARIILHCFEYGRSESSELIKYCEEVHYYKRSMSMIHQFSFLPFIVKSRTHPKLYQRLLADNFPIIFEGTHVCSYINDPKLKNRVKLVRMHNIEWKYYHNLAVQEQNIFKRLFFHLENKKLKSFELKTIVKHADHLLAVSPTETEYFKALNHQSVHYLAAFHENEEVTSIPGKSDYVIYHGDLSVKDNENAAIYLIEKVFSKLDIKFVVAGLNPQNKLKTTVSNYDNVELIPNVPMQQMENLIQEAHVNLLISFNSAGMKLKLLNAIYRGRFCMVNNPMVLNTGLEQFCIIKNTPEEMVKSLKEIMNQTFSTKEINARKDKLAVSFSNIYNAKTTMKLLSKSVNSKT